MKQCKYCYEQKSSNEFSPHPHTRDRLSSKCKQCVREYCRNRWATMSPERRAKTVARNKELKRINPQTYSRSDRCKAFRRKYGITLSCYEKQWAIQDKCCAICQRTKGDSERLFAVDHCHVSGKLRGILCHQCNVDLGRVEKYLREPDRINAYLASPAWVANPLGMAIPMTLILEDGADHPNPCALLTPDRPVDGNPVYDHPPSGHLIPVQQDIPASCHDNSSSVSHYLRPSKFG